MAKSKKSSSGKNQKLDIQSMAIIGIILLIGLGIPLYFYWQVNHQSSAVAMVNLLEPPGPGIEPSLVCMVNDAYMGKDQIPVPHEKKVYFGCCKMCVTRIQNDESVRFAEDPLTKELVDKANAYIVLDPNGKKNEVLYFESKAHFDELMGNK